MIQARKLVSLGALAVWSGPNEPSRRNKPGRDLLLCKPASPGYLIDTRGSRTSACSAVAMEQVSYADRESFTTLAYTLLRKLRARLAWVSDLPDLYRLDLRSLHLSLFVCFVWYLVCLIVLLSTC